MSPVDVYSTAGIYTNPADAESRLREAILWGLARKMHNGPVREYTKEEIEALQANLKGQDK